MKMKINLFTGFLLSIGAVIILGVLFETKFKMFAACTLASTFCFAKLNLAFTFNKGHGLLDKNKFKIRGFSIGKIVCFCIPVILLGTLLIYSFTLESYFYTSTVQNIQYFIASMIATIWISLLVWHYYWYDKTYYCSEFELRMALKKRRFSQQFIESKIYKLKTMGAIE